MANLLDYIDWRGDLTFSQSKFNIIDTIICSQIVMLDLSKIVLSTAPISVNHTKIKYDKLGRQNASLGLIVPNQTNDLLGKMANSVRFGKVKLLNYVRIYDEKKEEQFDALTIDFPDKIRVVSFAGTDDTLIGWKENFNMIYRLPTCAQIDATEYLNNACKNYHGDIVVVGHSKGGNLALYSSVYCEPKTQDKITKVVSVDGPGLNADALNDSRYEKILDRMVSVIPQSSIVGRLFGHKEKIIVVTSLSEGMYQHDCYTWQVVGTNFVYQDKPTQESDEIDETVKKIVDNMDLAQRETFVNAMHSLFWSTGLKNLLDVSKARNEFLLGLMKLDNVSKRALTDVTKELFKVKAIRKFFFANLNQFRLLT